MKKILLLILSIFMVLSFTACSSEKSPERIQQENEMEAWTYIQIYVERKLKAPSTAKFQAYGWESVEFDYGTVYKFSSYVDSQNGFGAMLRTKFHGYIKKDGENWKMLEFTMK